MTTLDRSIARQFFFNTCALLVLLFSFVVAVDVSLNIDRFLKAAEENLQGEYLQGGSPSAIRKLMVTALLVVDLWWPKLLQLFSYMVGLALVGAMGFTLTQMVRHRELVAALAGGISLRRIAAPVLVVALAMMGLKVIDQEFVLSNPRIAPLLTRDHGDAGARDWSAFSVPPTADGAKRVFMAHEFLPKENRLVRIRIWDRDPQGRTTTMTSAPQAIWRDGAWELENARIERLILSPTGADAADTANAAAAAVRVATDLDPAALLLRRYASFSQSLSWRQISSMLESPGLDPSMRQRLERARWGRISTALSTVLTLVITLPFFLVREPRNMLVQSLKCAPIGIFALLGSVFGAAIDVPGLPVQLAVFLPVLILIPITIAAWTSIRT